jgi:hypothetical protein
VIALGDADGDGTPDFAASSSQLCFGFCASRPGEVIAYSGASGNALTVYEGEINGDSFGAALAAGDLDADGGVDLVACAPFHGSGRAYVFLDAPLVAACPADIDGSGGVDVSDLLAVLSVWGACGGCAEDVDGDGDVGVNDLLAVLAAWGSCP